MPSSFFHHIISHKTHVHEVKKQGREKPQKGKIEERGCLRLFAYLITRNKETTCHASCC